MTDDETRGYTPQPVTPQTAMPQASGPGTPDLRGGLGRLSRGLIAYGLIGLVVAAIGFGALVWVNGRIASVGDRVTTSVDEIATTLERTAVALEDASTTAESFTGTIDRTVEGVSAAADTIAGVRSNLQTLASVLDAVNILGLTPLGPAATAVGDVVGWEA